jgi:hypothetical protein
MDLRGLGAFLSAIAGYFSAQAGAKAGQLQGLLMGEELTERRKRMKMAEEAHQLQTELARAREAREAELFPVEKGLREEELRRRRELFPYEKEALATQVDASKLNLLNNRLWSMYQRGVVPSQVSDPVLRAEYEPFFNYQVGVKSLEAVQTEEELQAILGKVPEEWRPSLEILGRANLFTNQMRQQMMERQLQGADINLAQGEFQLRTAKLNFAINTILNNINSEGMDWDKRTPQQKIEAVKKWLSGLGLDDVVSENFANMFQRVKSTDARQFALYRLQAELQHRFSADLARQQFGYNQSLQREAWMSNIVAGALTGGMGAGVGGGVAPVGGGVAPVGFPALPPIPTIFNNTYDNRGSNLNISGLTKYLNSAPFEIPVPFGNGYQPLSVIGAQAEAVYKKLGRPNATLTTNDINTVITFEAGLLQSHFAKHGMELDWNSALAWATERILPSLKANPPYEANANYRKTLNEWEQAWRRKLQQGTPPASQGGGQRTAPASQGGGQRTPPASQRGGQRTQTPPMTQGEMPRGQIGRQP